MMEENISSVDESAAHGALPMLPATQRSAGRIASRILSTAVFGFVGMLVAGMVLTYAPPEHAGPWFARLFMAAMIVAGWRRW